MCNYIEGLVIIGHSREITSGLSLYAQPALDARLARERRVVRYSGSQPSRVIHSMKG